MPFSVMGLSLSDVHCEYISLPDLLGRLMPWVRLVQPMKAALPIESTPVDETVFNAVQPLKA